LMATERLVLEASSVGEEALAILSSSSSGRVQGVYRGGVNIAFPAGLVSLVPESSGKGPLNVTLAAPDPEGMLCFGLEAGEPVSAEGGRLLVGAGLAVSFAAADRYSGALRLSHVVSEAQLRRNIEEARKTGLAYGNLSGLGGLLAHEHGKMAGSSSGHSNLFSASAARRIDSLVEAFRRRDPTSLSSAVSELIGLGPGLTPASDDFLAGLAIFVAARSASSSSLGGASRAIAGAISGQRPGTTTALSEAYLKQAAAGKGNEAVIALCRALLTEEVGPVARESMRLVSIGETSGTDALLGVVVGGILCSDDGHDGRDSTW
jgi:hypothetical protein